MGESTGQVEDTGEKNWSHSPDLNRRPAVYETAALPTELLWPSLHIKPHHGSRLRMRRPHEPERRRSALQRLDSLIPSPRTSGYFEDPEPPVLKEARAHWFPTASVLQCLDEWLSQVQGNMHSVDALVGFLETRPVREQVWPGLDWIRRIVIDEDRTAAALSAALTSAGAMRGGEGCRVGLGKRL